MKKISNYLPCRSFQTGLFFLFLIFLFGLSSCIKDHDAQLGHFQQVNLVSDTAGYGAARTDPNLTNAWGIAVSPTGVLWISANHSGLSTVYDAGGNQLRPPVVIPGADEISAGAPTGQLFNNTTDFVIPSTGTVSKFIFAGEDGIISAWNTGNNAQIVANRSANEAVYKGITMAQDAGHNFLYATNFKGRAIDVFDDHFNYVTDKPFYDPTIPADYGPFNIRNISGKLYVTYAKLKGPDNEDDEAGPGNGFVDIYNPAGLLLRRFATHGKLNSPWGIAEVSQGFATTHSAILIGNFGDGRINVFDESGEFEGQLRGNGQPITIEGLWALEAGVPGNTDRLFFTAGPGEEEHGLFGYIKKQ